MENLKFSHIDRNMVTNTITWLKLIYVEMHRSWGKKHDYLGMWLDFSLKGKVKVSMEDYLKKVIDKFP